MKPALPITVYQNGRDVPESVALPAERILRHPRVHLNLISENALVFNKGAYEGNGSRPGGLSLRLGHDYSERNVRDDFNGISAALNLIGYPLVGAVDLRLAQGHEKGLENLNEEFNFMIRGLRTRAA